MTYIGVIGFGLLVIGVWIMARKIHATSKRLKVIIHEPRINDDDRAVGNFMDLLKQAHSNMTIYDDGDKADGSLYMDEAVLSAIHKKLDTMPDFTIRCFFNDAAATRFRQEFGEHDQVVIRIRPEGDLRPDDTHYKIIDDGRMAYLSRHEHGSTKREFQVIDCTRISGSELKERTDTLLGEYKKDIAQKFPAHPTS